MQAYTISWTYDPSDLAPPYFQSFPLSLKPFCSRQFLLHFPAFVYIALWIYSFMFYFCVLRPTRYVLKYLTQHIKGTHLWAALIFWYTFVVCTIEIRINLLPQENLVIKFITFQEVWCELHLLSMPCAILYKCQLNLMAAFERIEYSKGPGILFWHQSVWLSLSLVFAQQTLSLALVEYKYYIGEGLVLIMNHRRSLMSSPWRPLSQ